jgi:hypothetical protein
MEERGSLNMKEQSREVRDGEVKFAGPKFWTPALFFFVFGKPHSSVFAKHDENEAGVRNFGRANPTLPSRTSPLRSFVFGKH